MPEEQLYTVDGSSMAAAVRVALSEAGLREREHLQEWVLSHPEILGEDVLVVTFEFDRWMTHGGNPTLERLDVLALDRTGRLVLAELKRDRAPDSVMVQALNYAAMSSRFSLDELAEAYAARKGGSISTTEALGELEDWAPMLTDETLSPPRIVLLAEDFGPVLTNTAMFLIEQGLDLRLIRVQLYRIGETLALTTSQVLPVPDAESFMVRPRSGIATQRSSRAAAQRRASIPERLVLAGVYEEGAPLQVAVPSNVGEDRDAIAEWLQADPRRAHVYWRQDPREPVSWEVDGEPYNLTRLIRTIIESATGNPPRTQIWGPNWYRDAHSVPLYKVAESLADAPNQGFDWRGLHQLLKRLPAGRWASYGDVATVVGTGAQALGQHLANCLLCVNAHRVLDSQGRSRPNFRRSDQADSRSQQEQLVEEGVRFAADMADTDRRLTLDDLHALLRNEK